MVEAWGIIMLRHTKTIHHLIQMHSRIPLRCLPILISSSITSGRTTTINLCRVLLSIQLLGSVLQIPLLLILLQATPILATSHLHQALHHGRIIQLLLLRLLCRYCTPFALNNYSLHICVHHGQVLLTIFAICFCLLFQFFFQERDGELNIFVSIIT
jgi:hypothetical protein